MTTTQLDKEEQELLNAYESGEFQSEMTPSRKEFIEQSAAQTFKTDKIINIRLSERDFSAIQRRALEEGIPYQTLVVSVLHKYASGSLYDATANKADPADARPSGG